MAAIYTHTPTLQHTHTPTLRYANTLLDKMEELEDGRKRAGSPLLTFHSSFLRRWKDWKKWMGNNYEV